MKRRPFLKQATASLASLPLAVNAGVLNTLPESNWKDALQVLSSQCNIKAVHSLLCFQFMPSVPDAVKTDEFKKADDNFYFYNNEQGCFRVFEKTHPGLGVIALLIPFWTKQPDGSWKKVACLSQYEWEALAKACTEQPQLKSQHLLPVMSTQSLTPGSYATESGTVALRSVVSAGNKINCTVQVKANQEMVLHSQFAVSAVALV